MELTTLFCQIDDFCADFEAEYYKHLMDDGKIKRVRKSRLSLSEVMTIIIQFQRSGYRTFKHYYQRPVSVYLRWAFLLSTPCRLPSAIIEEFPPIVFLLKRLNGGRTRLVGSMVSNFISSLMMKGNC